MKGFYCVINAQVGGSGADRKLLDTLSKCEAHAKSILRNRCDPREGTVLLAVKIEKVIQFEPHPIQIIHPNRFDFDEYFR